MEERRKLVNTRELLDAYRELLPQVPSLPLRISGVSMTPFLIHDRDSVHLALLREAPRRGDIVLYQRENGDYVLHRICKVHGDTYDLIGDAQTVIEPGVRRQQLVGKVLWAERNGKKQSPGSFWWEFFEKIWIRVIPLRPVLWKGYHGICKLRAARRKPPEV